MRVVTVLLLHDKEKVYLKGKDKIVPPFRFGVEDVATKMWFHKLAYPGQCLTNSHLDIIFYYLRKKGKYAKEPKVKFTTTDCLFFKTIHDLYEKFIAQKKNLSLITAQHAIADYIRGRKMLCGSPWHLCDHVLFIIHMETESHWILARLNIEERRMYMYNSLSTAMKDSAAIKACQPFAVLLPQFFALFDEFKKENKPVCLDPFEVVKVDGLPQQTSNDCGCFVASFAEYFIDMKPIPPIFDVEKHRDRVAVLFYKYARMKELDFIDSEDETPPKDYVHDHRQVVVSIICIAKPNQNNVRQSQVDLPPYQQIGPPCIRKLLGVEGINNNRRIRFHKHIDEFLFQSNLQTQMDCLQFYFQHTVHHTKRLCHDSHIHGIQPAQCQGPLHNPAQKHLP
ncbi:hypothetical protein F8388_022697 [Cannabis sativa]|uniref:Ubiquitin-like protease family profile domain-containing protein n=1 Tax=Cannabis sativa TaxID=3483 RepID=A0A7J6G1V7_CANSA|nr:hypothetical protein F8388_022697 [Cannabis sativa]